uniref:Alanine dehydrogenase/pyridine nucleotide transhydrogenase NAD(H)-binding domain-containing protein n=2 Tax=Spongospora subterranea TaxID=70186 RepID=A0A0H5QFE8_9EUKA|eukprot:CRZ00675.1 hypothetical protein [Spongospora subterranea]
MIDLCRGLGERFLSMGYSTPFTSVPSAYMHASLTDAKHTFERVGEEIKRLGLPAHLSPLTFAFTGSGNVAKGALEIFDLLPHEMLSIDDVRLLKEDQATSNHIHHKVYGVHVQTKDLVAPIDSSQQFSRDHYYAHPEQYKPVLQQTLLPYINVLVNGVYWEPRFPRILTSKQAAQLPNLYAVGDISCDIDGSVQFVSKSTTISSPFYCYDPSSNLTTDGLDGPGIAVLAVDNLPAELPREASWHFSKSLVGFAEDLSSCSAEDKFPDSLPLPLRRACIVSNRKLRPDFEYIDRLRQSLKRSSGRTIGKSSSVISVEGHLFDTGLINQILDHIEKEQCTFEVKHLSVQANLARNKRKSHAIIEIATEDNQKLKTVVDGVFSLISSIPAADGTARILKGSRHVTSKPAATDVRPSAMRKIVLLGSGFVASPVADILGESSSNHVIIASDDLRIARQISSQAGSNTEPLQVDCRDQGALRKVIDGSSLVISLLPARLHEQVAQLCLSCGCDMVTASYVSKEMYKLHEYAKEKGRIILNECGLDPGLDHMSAMKMIDEIKAHDGMITSFESSCGGLPAPEAADNPFGYKFSWSPRGAILAALNDAVFKRDSKIVAINGSDILSSVTRLFLTPALNLENYPNRDCLPYAREYGLENTTTTFYRGTIRYAGFASLMNTFKTLGLLSTDNSPLLHGSWPNFLEKYLNCDDVRVAIKNRVNRNHVNHCLEASEWLGILNEDCIIAKGASSPIDAFTALLEQKMKFTPNERDMVILRHDFSIKWPNALEMDHATSTLVQYGAIGGYSAMAQTVGVTTALAAQLVLNGDVERRGVLKPTTPDIYRPILEQAEQRGIVFSERLHFPE